MWLVDQDRNVAYNLSVAKKLELTTTGYIMVDGDVVGKYDPRRAAGVWGGMLNDLIPNADDRRERAVNKYFDDPKLGKRVGIDVYYLPEE